MVRVLSIGLLVWVFAGPAAASVSDERAANGGTAFSAAGAMPACGQVLGSNRCSGKCVRCNATCAQSVSCAVSWSACFSFAPHQELSSALASRVVDESRAPDTDPPKRSSA